MIEFDLNNPFNEASKDGMLPDGCGIFERYYTNGQEVDFCGLSPDPKDYDTPQTLYYKILELVKRIIIAVDLNTNGSYKPSDFDKFPLISTATSVKDAIERLSKFIEYLQINKFDKVNLKLKYENGNVSLAFNDVAYSTINIPEEQFLDGEQTTFISAATAEDYMHDNSVIIGDPYLKLVFKTIDDSGAPSLTYTYIPMDFLNNVYTVSDTNSIDTHITPSGDTFVISADLIINNDNTNAIKLDNLGVYVKDLTPVIDNEIIRATDSEAQLGKDIKAEETRASNMEYNIINMVSNETDRAVKIETQLQTQITAETVRATDVENQLYSRITDEVNRASSAEANLRDNLNDEIQRSENKDAQLNDKIDAEITRSESVETQLQTNIDNEIIRATNAEKVNSDAIQSEIVRATDAENILTTNLANEVIRAKAVEAKKVENVQPSNGISVVTSTGLTKDVTVSGVVSTNDKILSVDNTGFKSTLNMTISDKTISLVGNNNVEIANVVVPGSDLTFANNDGITLVNTSGTVTPTIILDPIAGNKLTKSANGLSVVSDHITLIDTVGGTKILNTTANMVVIQTASQVNYIGISNTQQTSVTFYNNSNLEALFSFNNSTALTNKFIKDYLITTLALPPKSSVEFFKTSMGWHIASLFGVSYFPDLGDLTRTDDYALIVKKDGTATIEEIVNMKEWDESILTPLTTAELETRFPDVAAGFQFVTPTLGVIYEKANDFGDWLKITAPKNT